MAAINTNIGASFLKFTFTDADGDIVASFRLNPADIKLAERCKEVSAYFKKLSEEAPENATLEDAIKLNDQIEGKICYLLGYDARDSLFGLMSATTIMGDGNMFAACVLNKIVEAVEPELQKRQKSMAAAVAKHTGKYKK